MELLLIYSDKCKHSQNIKNYKIFNEIDKLNIDNKNELKQLPKYVKTVPTLMIKKNDKFSSNFSFIDSKSDNLLENFYSSIDSNIVINTPNNADTRQNKSLDTDYEKLMQERNNEFKSIERH